MGKVNFFGIGREYEALKFLINNAHDTIMKSGRVMDGSYTKNFEKALARRAGVSRNAITVHSGTNALEIAAQIIRRSSVPRRENPVAVVPALTYPATANAMVTAGYRLHIVDVNEFGLLDVKQLPPSDDIDLLVYVGLYGQCYHEEYIDWYKSRDQRIKVIDDAAQSFDSTVAARRFVANIRCLSFDPTKTLANFGNGGAIVTDNDHFAAAALNIRGNGKAAGHDWVGTNSRMSEMDCATLLLKLSEYDEWQKKRQNIALYYAQRFEKYRENIRLVADIADRSVSEHSWQKFVIEVDDRDELKKYLEMRDIETKIHYNKAIHELGAFQHYPGPGVMAVASSLARRVISLPIYPFLSEMEMDQVATAVCSFYETRSRKAKPIHSSSLVQPVLR